MKSAIIIAAALSLASLSLAPVQAQTTPEPSSATELSLDDQNAYFAVGRSFDAADLAISKAMTDEVFKTAKSDPVKLCQLASQQTQSRKARLLRERAYLRDLQKAGKSVESLIRSYLSSSEVLDKFAMGQADYCAKTKAGGDDVKEAIIYVQDLLAQLDAIKAAYQSAINSDDKPGELAALQSQPIYLDEIVAYIEILRDAVENPGPTIKGLVARLDVLKYELEEVSQLNRKKVHPYTDPTGEVYGPYVFKPMEIPELPTDDDAFQKAASGLMLEAIMPATKTLPLMLKGDKAMGCQGMKDSHSELLRLKAFIVAYIEQQRRVGKDLTVAQRLLGKVEETIATMADTEQSVCTA